MRILISAYACAPGRGSESGAGWEWACAAARAHTVWVLTHASNAPLIDAALAEDRVLASRLHPVYLRNPRYLRPLRGRGPGRFVYYLWWQLGTCRRAARVCHSRIGFQACHHVTYAADWLPVGISTLRGIPLIWGPIGGSSTTGNPRLWMSLGPRAFLLEAVRTLSLTSARQLIGRSIAKKAAVVLAQNDDVAARFAPFPVIVEPNVALRIPGGESPGANHLPTTYVRLGQPVAVYAGRLLAWKGLRLALAALRRPEASHWRFDIYGAGPERRRLERMAMQWGLTDRVTFHGHRPRAEILEALTRADVFLFPSTHDAAGWSVAEAMASGCPVLCLAMGGPATLVEPRDGVIIPPTRDLVGELAKGLDRARAIRPRRDRWRAERLPSILDAIYPSAEPNARAAAAAI